MRLATTAPAITAAPTTNSPILVSSSVRYTLVYPSCWYHSTSVQIDASRKAATTSTPSTTRVGIRAPRRRRDTTGRLGPRRGSCSKLTGGELTHLARGSPRDRPLTPCKDRGVTSTEGNDPRPDAAPDPQADRQDAVLRTVRELELHV